VTALWGVLLSGDFDTVLPSWEFSDPKKKVGSTF
jgi:hypothetical protein